VELNEPTSEECLQRKIIYQDDIEILWATYYPQMGGYIGKAIVKATKQPSNINECFDVFVWHDGEFPFDGESSSPVLLHHCMAEQFVNFGNEVLKMTGGE
jgi:hypothetical protein